MELEPVFIDINSYLVDKPVEHPFIYLFVGCRSVLTLNDIEKLLPEGTKFKQQFTDGMLLFECAIPRGKNQLTCANEALQFFHEVYYK
jgi:hypothetical protein